MNTCTVAGTLAAAPATYREPHRPQLSYSPARNWMNDPNGLVYCDGEFHLFYQYNPNAQVWGDMSWGHAVSTDLLHWRELPLALPVEKDEQGAITQCFYSGSAVLDVANTSGLGASGVAPMVIIYTGVYPQAGTLAHGGQVREGQQSQSLAYSLDRGRSWTQYAGNPVLALPPEHYRDEYREFRDPKVFWYAPQSTWVMVVVVAHRHTALFYASSDLLQWELTGEFGPAGATGGVWECPDLFELPVDGDAARSKWVLVINLTPGGPAGGSGAQYFIGQFDGRTFHADAAAGAAPVRWLDHGPDFYAAVSWNDAPDGRRLLIGWMSNWLYAKQVPTAPWRGAQSVVRELALRTIDGQVRLVQQPVAALAQLRGAELPGAGEYVTGAGAEAHEHVCAAPAEIELVLEPRGAQRAGVKLHVGANGQHTVVGYDCARGAVYVDRRHAGDASFDPAFAACHAAPVTLRDGALSLRILLDRASVTVFAGAHDVVLTSQVFPSPGNDGLVLFAEGGQARVRQLRIWPLASIWPSS